MNFKKISIILIVFIYVIISVNISYAENLKATIDISVDKTEVTTDDYITFDFTIKDISNAEDNMISAAEGILTYDLNFFEEISTNDLSSIEINTKNGRFNSVFSASSTTKIGSIKLKVKSTAKGTGTVTFSNLQASDGSDIAETKDKTFTIKIKEPSANPLENTSNQTNTVNNEVSQKEVVASSGSDIKRNTNKENTSKDNKNTIINNSSSEKEKKSPKILPKTGLTNFIIFIILIIIVGALLSLKKYINNKDIK